MNPAPFEYHKAGSVDEAIGLLQQFEGEAKLLAGGHSLLPAMKLRLAQPGHLIDLAGIAGLSGVRRDGNTIVVGALTTHHDVEHDETVRQTLPVLAEAAGVVGDRQVRNRGTIGGTLAHADPAADYPAAVLALDAEIAATGPSGSRTIPAGEFFVDFLTTSLEPEEVLTEIRIPVPAERSGTSYQKLANQASGFAMVGIAAVVTLGADGSCQDVRIGITGAGSHAVRATAVEDALRGSALDDAAIQAAAEHAGEGVDFLDDIHGSAEYRRRVTIGLTQRAIRTAVDRGGRS
ncbi:MAG: FAD binding domain-containing protein [Thermomicrobiales bacterium]